MRTIKHPISALVFVAIALLLAAWQATANRVPTGLALAAPWGVSAVALAFLGRSGAWLAAFVAAISLLAAGWIFVISGSGQGREVAEALFASRDGFFSWADVAIVSAGLGLLFFVTLFLAARVIVRDRPRLPTER